MSSIAKKTPEPADKLVQIRTRIRRSLLAPTTAPVSGKRYAALPLR